MDLKNCGFGQPWVLRTEDWIQPQTSRPHDNVACEFALLGSRFYSKLFKVQFSVDLMTL